MDFFNNKIAYLEKENQENLLAKNEPKKNTNLNIKKYEENDNVLLTKSVICDIDKFSSGNYIPKKINKAITLPIDKNSKEYEKVKKEIISNIEDGMCELEYFNMDYAMEHVETALYYLKNIKQ